MESAMNESVDVLLDAAIARAEDHRNSTSSSQVACEQNVLYSLLTELRGRRQADTAKIPNDVTDRDRLEIRSVGKKLMTLVEAMTDPTWVYASNRENWTLIAEVATRLADRVARHGPPKTADGDLDEAEAPAVRA
jgi:hypothetical protein